MPGDRVNLNPDGGEFNTAQLVKLWVPGMDDPSIRIYYNDKGEARAENLRRTDGLPPYVKNGGTIVISKSTILRTRAFQAPYTNDDYVTESYTTLFEVSSGRYGYGYFVPFYNSAGGYSGKFTRVDLQSRGEVPDFSNFQTELGQGSYEGQLRVLDLAKIDSELIGFQGGFQALAVTKNHTEVTGKYARQQEWQFKNRTDVHNYAYLVPFFNGKFHGKLVRINLDFFALCGVEPLTNQSLRSQWYFELETGRWKEETKIMKTRGPEAITPTCGPSVRIAGPDEFKSIQTDGVNVQGFYTHVGDEIGGQLAYKQQDKPPPCAATEEAGGLCKTPPFPGKHYLYYHPNAFDIPCPNSFDTAGWVVSPVMGSLEGALLRGCNNTNITRVIAEGSDAKPITMWDGVTWEYMKESGRWGFTQKEDGELAMIRYLEPSGQQEWEQYYMYAPVCGIGWKGNACGVDVIDLENTSVCSEDVCGLDPSLKGFMNGFQHNGYGYLVPFNNGQEFTSKVVRFDVATFHKGPVEVLDVADALGDKAACGFNSGAAYEGRGYLFPYRHATSVIEGQHTTNAVNSKLPVDEGQFTAATHGKIVRFNLTSFDKASVQVLDLTQKDDDLRGFSGGFIEGSYLYLVPFVSRHFGGDTSLPKPFRSGYNGKLVRVNLDKFDLKHVEVLVLTNFDDDLRGFSGGFSSGRHGYLVPYENVHFTTSSERNYREQRTFGKVVRFDLLDFDLKSLKVYNLPTMDRAQLPPTPDHHLRGFMGGFPAGDYAYFVPSFNGDFFGKVPRLHMTTGELQFIDMQQDGSGLSGFSGGFTHRDRQICYSRKQFGHRKDVGANFNGAKYLDTLEERDDLFNACGSRPAPGASFLQQMALQTQLWMPFWAVSVMGDNEWASYVRMQPTERDRINGNNAQPEGLYAVLKRRLRSIHPNEYGLWDLPVEDMARLVYHKKFDQKVEHVGQDIGGVYHQIGGASDCCNFYDQHEVEYVLWDRRAYTRDYYAKKTEERVTPPKCLYAACKLDPTFR